MREFLCPLCRHAVLFEHVACARCGHELIFDASHLKMEERLSAPQPCWNREIIGCNWIAEGPNGYCRSCRLTRTIPNLDSARNVMLWRRVEQAKRRLVYDLARLRLPLVSPAGSLLAFDILSDEVSPILTGHLFGLITLNLAEADDVEREQRRVAFREPYRTLLGHFRHEIGHFYWDVLVHGTTLQAPFRLIFGDETDDYQAALRSYHGRVDRSYDRTGFISEYATSHPWEDWAETFAHFLHIVSALDSVAGLPLSLDERARQTLTDPYLESDFEALLSLWAPLSRGINELNRSLGMSDAYPFDISPAVKGKLHLVHMAISAFREHRQTMRADATGVCEPVA
ncbi:putative zinc-binding metallopeptidase [Bradyrhizobium sp. BR 10289]|uniref:zinc-binding metallopeptidase family protein n=1 Tax=Bradyrhizobium sp. BR 10289 TaxID=2749993 RepID=UPI001C6539E3|nr:putative zinc-binding metallopeptidase [Bradyrhizobium sp. BR 10289]MBW7970390.1 putative zinc-binding metallopeptidase [Bradyrhizobium sp. BR 10289]